MAGEWIKMRGNLWDDPRIGKLCDLTDCGEAQIIGGLYWLWAAADQHTENGVMPGLSLRQIDRKTGINGFGDALCNIGWLADHPEGVRIVNFEEHNGASAKKRSTTAKRVANHRNGNSDVTQPALQNDDTSVTGALAREEKRRKEVKPMSGKPDAIEVLAYLNQKAKREYRAVDSNLKLIASRLGEGASVSDCKAVIDAKVKDWISDPKMVDYLRPETLFNATKFAGYVGSIGIAKAAGGADPRFAGAK